MAEKIAVLFVCMGNICRSPTGEMLFRHLVEDAGLADRFEIDSAGTIGYHAGEPPDRRMTAAAQKRGYAMTGCARQFRVEDFDRFDYIVAMDQANHRDICALDGKERHRAKVHLMMDFHPAAPTRDVPDPYYGGPEGFDHVMDLVEAASRELLARIREERGL